MCFDDIWFLLIDFLECTPGPGSSRERHYNCHLLLLLLLLHSTHSQTLTSLTVDTSTYLVHIIHGPLCSHSNCQAPHFKLSRLLLLQSTCLSWRQHMPKYYTPNQLYRSWVLTLHMSSVNDCTAQTVHAVQIISLIHCKSNYNKSTVNAIWQQCREMNANHQVLARQDVYIHKSYTAFIIHTSAPILPQHLRFGRIPSTLCAM